MTERDTHEAGTPRWVKVSGISALVLVVLVLVMLVAGRGGHGPGQHTPSADTRGHRPPAGVHTRP